MNRHMHAGLLATLLLLITAIYTVVGVQVPSFSNVVVASPGSIGNGEPITLNTYTPPPLPFNGPEIVNPMRGLYRWRTQEVAPQPRPSFDAYDRFEWRALEPERGRYDFSLIDRELRKAEQEGRKYAFRIRAMIHGEGPQVPDYLVDAMEKGWTSGGTYIPDWNDPNFLERVDALIKELGRRYDGDPRLGWVDVGIYGNWGEWHMWPFEYPSRTGAEDMSKENLKKIVDAHAAAFTNTPVIMMTEDEEILIYALKLSPRIGWRRDSLGSDLFTENTSLRKLRQDAEAWELFVNRWKTAPVISEFINPNAQSDPRVYQLAREQAAEYHVSLVSNGNTLDWNRLGSTGRANFIQLGKETGYRYELESLTMPSALRPGFHFPLELNWKNVGNAPVYEYWEVMVQLRRAGNNTPLWEWHANSDLRTVLPTTETGAVSFGTNLLMPANVPSGNYDLHIVVRDPKNYRKPLALAIEGRFEDGSHFLGQIQVQAASSLQSQIPQVYVPILFNQ